MIDGIGVSSRLLLLRDGYERLADAGVPPGVDAANYLARLSTLETLTDTDTVPARRALREQLPRAAVSVDAFGQARHDTLTQVRQRVTRDAKHLRGRFVGRPG